MKQYLTLVAFFFFVSFLHAQPALDKYIVKELKEANLEDSQWIMEESKTSVNYQLTISNSKITLVDIDDYYDVAEEYNILSTANAEKSDKGISYKYTCVNPDGEDQAPISATLFLSAESDGELIISWEDFRYIYKLKRL
ncbi:MAG: hypothetical protein ACK5IJ_02675 [Mangrovibacterium sp.]